MSSYAESGVSIEEGDRAVELMKAAVSRTNRAEVLGGIGGFAGLTRIPARYREPILATSTDGVGTKIEIARAMDKHDTIGIDLVAMVIDDLVVVGAEPLYMTDYIATGKVDAEKIATIVAGIAKGCELAGATLIGGETAEHPGVMHAEEYDLSGAGTGVVEADELLGPERVEVGDVVIAMASSGLHSNGYSLVRHVLLKQGGLSLDQHFADFGASGRSLGEELLEPTRIYALDCLALAAATRTRVFSHITGGGIEANLARVIPPGARAQLRRSTWRVPPIFELVQRTGRIETVELDKTLNLGVGMVAVLAREDESAALDLLTARGVQAWTVGEIVAGDSPTDLGTAGYI